MNTWKMLIGATIVAIPAMSFAQSVQSAQAPVTRAEVRADLIALEKAGYQPGRNDDDYPVDLQRAEAKVAAEQGVKPPVQTVQPMASMHAANTVPRIDLPRNAFYDGA